MVWLGRACRAPEHGTITLFTFQVRGERVEGDPAGTLRLQHTCPGLGQLHAATRVDSDPSDRNTGE